MRQKNLTEVCHVENDVLIYSNIADILSELNLFSNGSVSLTPIGDDYASAAFMYVNNVDILAKLNCLMLSLMNRGKEYLTKLFNQGANEMLMLSHIYKTIPGVIKYLPIQPCGKGAQGLNLFNGIFDPASIGQFLGGTNSHPSGWYGKDHHWIGASLHKKLYSFEWKVENGIKVPYLAYRNRGYKIHNLHIHSKRLKDFM